MLKRLLDFFQNLFSAPLNPVAKLELSEFKVNKSRSTNQNGIDLIKTYEGLVLVSYPDDGSELATACVKARHSLVNYKAIPNWETLKADPWTIGYGATGKDIVEGLVWTEQQCEDRLKQELSKHEQYVCNIINDPLSGNQYAALVSFTYNCGPSNLTKLRNGAKDISGVADRLVLFNKAKGKVMQGLTDRRLAERELFLTPDSELVNIAAMIQKTRTKI